MQHIKGTKGLSSSVGKVEFSKNVITDWTCRHLRSVGKEEVRQLQYNDVLKQPRVRDHGRDSMTALVATRKLLLYRGGRQIHDFGSNIVTGDKSLP